MKTDINERTAFENKTREYKAGVLTGLDWALDRSRLVRSCYSSNAFYDEAAGISEIIYELKKMKKAVQ